MGRFEATAYGPPWNAMEGSGVTSTGVDLRAGQQKLVVAVDPRVIPYGSKVKIWPNPFGDPNLIFTAADTGGAIKGNRIDFFVASGRSKQNSWGRRGVQVKIVGKGGWKDVATLGDTAARVVGGARQRAAGTPGSTTITPGKSYTDYSSAITDSLLAAKPQLKPAKAGGLGLLGDIQRRIESGAYTRTTDPTLKITPGTPASSAPKGGGGTDASGLRSVRAGDAYYGMDGRKYKISAKDAPNLVWWDRTSTGKPLAIPKWMAPQLVWARKNGWDGVINNGWRSYEHQYIIHNVQHQSPSAVPGTSRHEGSVFPLGAIDVANAAQLNRILQGWHGPGRRLVWAGGKDPVHFSIPSGGSY